MNKTVVEAMPSVGIAYSLVSKSLVQTCNHTPLESFDLLTLHRSVFVVR
ncbi:hypothetical protein P4V43_18745 [Brevibacillus fortis]|nr:hypothetical protein [Brevibacillus fortis]MED1783862.1 hypothetical protein [Brevibacillus fortis]